MVPTSLGCLSCAGAVLAAVPLPEGLSTGGRACVRCTPGGCFALGKVCEPSR